MKCTYAHPLVHLPTNGSKVMAEKLSNTLVSKLKKADKPYEVRDAVLKGLIIRVQPSGVMTYYLEYQRGKRMRVGPADALSPDQAREIAKGMLAQHYKGEDPIESKKRKQADTYEQFLDVLYKPYLEANLRNGINNEVNVKETMACLKGRFTEFKTFALNEITALSIEKWRQGRRQEGVKPASINRQLNDLRACLNRAVEWGALTVSPFEKVKPMKVDSSAKVRYLTREENQRLRRALDARESSIREARQNANAWREERGYKTLSDLSARAYADHLKPAVLLSLNTGLRQGELFSLKWGDIDFDRRNLTVVGATAKDGETRHIPLNEEALSILKQWKQQPGIKSPWVFHGEDGKPFSNVRTSWVGILAAAEIEGFRWHDLRHTFASNLVMAGVDLNTVRELLGHSDYKMTQRYAHLAPKHKQEAVDKLVDARAIG